MAEAPTGGAPARPARLAVLVSGFGSNLEAILRAAEDGRLPGVEVVVVGSNRPQAHGLERGRRRGIPTFVLEWPPFARRRPGRRDYDTELARRLEAFRPDWVVLAGWMRILSLVFLERFPGRVLNLHPARPGEFPGMGAIERAHQAAREGRLSSTGVTVHWVPDEGVDTGPPIVWEEVPVDPGESLEAFEERMHRVEHRLIVEAIRRVAVGTGSPTDGPAAA